MDLKLCPTCKTFVFEDMDTCYGCMYRFGSEPEREEAARREIESSDFPEAVLDDGKNSGEGLRVTAGGQLPWPPPLERSPVETEDVCGAQPPISVPNANQKVSANVVVIGAWRVGLCENTTAEGGKRLEIVIEPT